MLYGMADPIKAAVLKIDCRLREYCPVGELLPGMAYLVRRLLETTSNEGFLANKFAKGASREMLLRNPLDLRATSTPPSESKSGTHDDASPAEFKNEPPVDFTIDAERETIRAAIQKL